MSFMKDLWSLIHPYWRSEDRWKALVLLAACVAAEFLLAAVGVGFSTWQKEFFDAIQNRDLPSFMHQLLVWSAWFALLLAAIGGSYFSGQTLRLRWRRWLTRDLTERWLANRAYYRLQIESGGTDNPDQRIAEDAKLFVEKAVEFPLGILHATLGLVTFSAILWKLSENFDFFGIAIPGFLCWAALIYAVFGTWLIHSIGRRLSFLDFRNQRFEADFRYSLVRIRENAQSIALCVGERREARTLGEAFEKIFANWNTVILNQTKLEFTNRWLAQFSNIFPYFLMAPRYFAGHLELGTLMQAQQGFWQIELSLRWLMTNYSDLAAWRATINRLISFRNAIEGSAVGPQFVREKTCDGDGIVLDGVELRLPNGRPLTKDLSMTIPEGSSFVITGSSGCGKSTLFGAIAGIWPYGEGSISLPGGARLLFLPQRPYLPVGRLRQALTYPDETHGFSDERLATVLRQTGLSAFADDLDETSHWMQRLSPGEQQRLSFARALLIRPDFLFLDEATSAVTESAEADLYRLLATELPKTAVISIAHRSTVSAFHRHHFSFPVANAGYSSAFPAQARAGDRAS